MWDAWLGRVIENLATNLLQFVVQWLYRKREWRALRGIEVAEDLDYYLDKLPIFEPARQAHIAYIKGHSDTIDHLAHRAENLASLGLYPSVKRALNEVDHDLVASISNLRDLLVEYRRELKGG